MDHEEIEEYEIHDQDMNDEDEVENQEVVPENEKKVNWLSDLLITIFRLIFLELVAH